MTNRKGPAFEREISKKLSLWWSKGEKDDVFWRTSGSGARATTRMKSGRKTSDSYGDLKSDCISGKPFTKKVLVEIKRGYSKNLSITSILDSKVKEPLLVSWWRKAEEQRKLHKRKLSLIIFKRDRKKICIVMNEGVFDYLFVKPCTHIKVQYEELNLAVMCLDDFINYCWNPNIVLEAAKVVK